MHIFLIKGYRFTNELISAKATTCAKINLPVCTVSVIISINNRLLKEMVASICKSTQ